MFKVKELMVEDVEFDKDLEELSKDGYEIKCSYTKRIKEIKNNIKTELSVDYILLQKKLWEIREWKAPFLYYLLFGINGFIVSFNFFYNKKTQNTEKCILSLNNFIKLLNSCRLWLELFQIYL